jgi:hypothetical protein
MREPSIAGDVGDGTRQEIDVVHAGDKFGFPY